MKRVKKFEKMFLAIALVAMSLCVVMMPAMAGTVADNSPGKIVLSDTTKGNCNMRNNPLDSSSKSIIAVLGHGTTLTVTRSATGYSANGSTKWYYVTIETPTTLLRIMRMHSVDRLAMCILAMLNPIRIREGLQSLVLPAMAPIAPFRLQISVLVLANTGESMQIRRIQRLRQCTLKLILGYKQISLTWDG